MNEILKPGTKVRIPPLADGKTYTISAYNEDMCGDGCCPAYDIEELPDKAVRPNSIQVLNDEGEYE
jgi:hypothetical protein